MIGRRGKPEKPFLYSLVLLHQGAPLLFLFFCALFYGNGNGLLYPLVKVEGRLAVIPLMAGIRFRRECRIFLKEQDFRK